MKGFTISCIAFLVFAARPIAAEIPLRSDNLGYSAIFQSIYRALVRSLPGQVLERLKGASLFTPQSDGGGDGGDGGGGDGGGDGGDGTGGDGSAGDGGADGGADSGDGDGPGDDTGSVGDPGDTADNDSPAQSDPTTDPANENATLSPTAPSVTVDVAQNAPNFGPGATGGAGSEGIPRNILQGGSRQPLVGPIPGGAGLTVGINAVIVSGAPSPWEAIGKVTGVRNVSVTGGIIALGETALAKPSLGVMVGVGTSPPSWLTFKPDFRYLNGSVFPPIVPNVIDIRTISYTEEATESPQK
jgi:hypothetical protein